MHGLMLPSSLSVPHYGQSSGRGLSPAIWSRFNSQALTGDGSNAYFIGDDFLCVGESVAVSSNIACFNSAAGQYKAYIDTSATLAQLATQQGGVISFGLDATDNHEVNLCQGGAGTSAATSVLGALFYDTVASRKKVAFECRFKVSSVVDDVAAIFLGLMEENGGVHNAKVDDTGVTIDNDYIGFDSVHTNGGTTGTNAVLRAVYKKDGQTAQTVVTAKTMVADTWYKVGFAYDPSNTPAKQITYYVDGVGLGTYVTATMMDAVTFPDGEEMGFTALAKSGTGTASTMSLDWWMAGFEG